MALEIVTNLGSIAFDGTNANIIATIVSQVKSFALTQGFTANQVFMPSYTTQ